MVDLTMVVPETAQSLSIEAEILQDTELVGCVEIEQAIFEELPVVHFQSV